MKKITWSKFKTLAHIREEQVSLHLSLYGDVKHIFGYIEADPDMVLLSELVTTETGTTSDIQHHLAGGVQVEQFERPLGHLALNFHDAGAVGVFGRLNVVVKLYTMCTNSAGS